MVEASTEFKKSGYTENDSATLAMVASMYQNVADEAISAGESASFIISQMKAFGIEASNAEHIINAVNATSNAYAVSSTDLAKGLELASAALSTSGNSFEEVLALLTSGTEITRNATKVGRGLVSVQSRLNQTVEETSTVGKALSDWYEQHGINIYDGQTGQLKTLYEILSELAPQWEGLSKNEKAAYLNMQAGANQTQNLAAILENFSAASEATGVALNSAGSAMEENSAYMESLEAKTNNLKATFEDLSNNVIKSDLVKSLLDIANGILSLINTPIGSFTAQVVLFTTAGWGLVQLFSAMNIVDVVGKQFTNLIPIVKNAILTIKGLQGPVMATSSAMGVALPIIGALTIAASAGIAIYDAMTTSLAEQREIVQNLASDVNSLQSEIDALKSKERLTEDDRERLEFLERELQVKERLHQIEQGKLFEQEYGTQVPEDLKKLYGLITAPEVSSKGGGLIGALSLQLDEASGQANGFIVQMENLKEKMDALDPVENAQEYNALVDQYNALKREAEETALKLEKQTLELEKNGEETGKLTPVQREFINSVKELIGYLESEGIILKDASADTEELAESTNYYNDVGKETINQIKDLSSVYKTLQGAVDEYNESGHLSIDTLESLLSLDSEYIGMLEVVNGKLVFNSQALLDKANKLKQNAIEERIAALSAELYAIATQSVTKNAENAETAIGNATLKVSTWDSIVRNAANGTIGLAEAVGSLDVAMGADPNWAGLSQAQKGEMEAAIGRAKDYINLVNQFSVQSFSSRTPTGSSSGGSSSSKKETDPIKAQSDAFKELNEVMEHNIKMREKQGASEQELIKLNKDYQKQLHEQAEWFRAHGEGEDSEYIRDLQNEYWSLQDTINSLEDQITQKNQEQFEQRLQISKDYIDERNYYADWGADNEIDAWKRVLVWMENEYYKKGLISYEEYAKNRKEILREIYRAEQEAAEEALQNEINTLQKKTNAYEALFSVVTSNIDDQIESLQKKRKDKEDYWNNEISALQKENDEIERQIELEQLQDNLARARQTNVMVYKDGRFQYIQDLDEISDAQLSLEKYEREEALRQEVENLEKLKEEALNAIDEQIKGWEEYKEAWGEVVKDYQKKENELLVERELGIKLEGENWKERLDNLEDYIEEYESLMSRLSQAQEAANNAQFGSSGGGGGSGGKDAVSEIDRQMANNSAMWPSASAEDKKKLEQANKDLAAERDKITGGHSSFNPSTGKWTKPGYARGTLSAPGGLSLVGEHGAEMRVINQGDGILPADITRNLWSWGMTTPADMMYSLSGMGKGSNGTNISIGTFAPNLPSVSNGEDFVRYLQQNFVREIIQYGNRR